MTEDELSALLENKERDDDEFVADLVDIYGATEEDLRVAGEVMIPDFTTLMKDSLEVLIERVRLLRGTPVDDVYADDSMRNDTSMYEYEDETF
jgi:hypothetical protein